MTSGAAGVLVPRVPCRLSSDQRPPPILCRRAGTAPRLAYTSSAAALIRAGQARHPVKTVATVFGVTPTYVSMLRSTAREQGSTGLVKTMGRPATLSAAQLAQARSWSQEGVSGQEIARRLGVSDTMISRLVGAGRATPAPAQGALIDHEDTNPRTPRMTSPAVEQAASPSAAVPAPEPELLWSRRCGGADSAGADHGKKPVCRGDAAARVPGPGGDRAGVRPAGRPRGPAGRRRGAAERHHVRVRARRVFDGGHQAPDP